MANIFMTFAPLEGWRHVEVTDRHTAVDYAQILKDISDRYFPNSRLLKSTSLSLDFGVRLIATEVVMVVIVNIL